MKDMGVKQPAKAMKLGKDEELETALYLCAYVVVLAFCSTNHHTFSNLKKFTNLNSF